MAIASLPRTVPGGNLAYADLREYIEHIDAMGVLKHVNGANLEVDIGQATDVLHHTAGSPAVLFDNIPGYPAGYRILVNPFNTHSRISFALGVPHDAPLAEMQAAWRKRRQEMHPIAPVYVTDGPVMENVMTGDDVNVLK